MTRFVGHRPLHHLYMGGVQSEEVVDNAGRAPSLAESARRLTSTPEWRSLKDTMYSLIAGRHDAERSAATWADVGDELTSLQVPEPTTEVAAAFLFDHGDDLGRHLLAKSLLHDDLAEALERLAAAIEGARLGRLDIDRVFHRTATVHLTTSKPSDQGPDHVHPFVSGLLHGSLSELFNSLVHLERDGAHELTIRLGPGLDVNEQEKQDG